MAPQLVWFKKDLRVEDHEPLLKACERRSVICIYVIEPEVISAQEFDPSHQVFINQCLKELHERLIQYGNGLIVLYDNLPNAFEVLRDQIAFECIWSHEETGNDISYKRDRRVHKWCKANGISFFELPQTGVIRHVGDMTDWKTHWTKFMAVAPMKRPDWVPPPETLQPKATQNLAPAANQSAIGNLIGYGAFRTLEELNLPPSTKPSAQAGGESKANDELKSFLYERSPNYRFELSSPVSGQSSCSRVSPYLSFGAISLRKVHNASVSRRAELAENIEDTELKSWRKSLLAFEQRLLWRSHYMQSLEDAPSHEFRNADAIYDGLRESEFNEEYFQAWCDGATGYPMIDACMRYVKAEGWLNYRMRAMLASFATNNLWLHWRRPALFLAKHFLDFEPGIHYAQFQMHAGTTPERAMLVYSPSKQARDQDPTGEFIRHNVPELSDIPIPFLHEPHLLPPLLQQFHGCVIGRDYPLPIVDEAASARLAKQRLSSTRKKLVRRPGLSASID